MKILFISHSYPPLVGGIENQNRDLSQGLAKIAKVKVIANGHGKWFLPFFTPTAFLRAFFLMMNYDVCLFGSGVLTPIGQILKFFHPKKKFFSVIHGLDVTYSNKTNFLAKTYKKINIPALKKMDKLFAVGNHTISEAVKAGIDKERCVFIPNGVNPEAFKEEHTRDELSKLFGKNTKERKVILRLARFVPHKGTSWFIENIMPRLPEHVVMIAAGNRVDKNTAGDKDDYPKCEQAIIDHNLQDRVKLMPCLPQPDVKTLLNIVDLVVSPNIKISGSMEGFGINVIEAGACGRVVIASNFEGLADAVIDGKNGFLVERENVQQWTKKIMAILDAKQEFRDRFGKRAEKFVKNNFSWDKICQKYLDEMKRIEHR